MLQPVSPRPDALDVDALMEASKRLSELATKLFARGIGAQGEARMDDPLGIAKASLALSQAIWANPERLAAAQLSLWSDYATLAQRTGLKMMGIDTDPVASPDSDDRRFRHAAWDDDIAFDVLKQAYLLTSRAWVDLVKDVDGLDARTREKLAFTISQMADALSPSNFALTNPQVLQVTAETGGRNLIDGLQNLMTDLAESDGQLNIKTTDLDAFEVGRNLAITPGKVIFENDLMQLIQYAPSTNTVYRTPLLIMPPWMNKYYIMDLQPGQLHDGMAGGPGTHGLHGLLGESR